MNARQRLALASLAVHLAASPALARGTELERRNTVRVGGEGRASAAPDVAMAFLGVEVLAPDLSTATRDGNERMRRVIDALSSAGVVKKDIQTTRYDVGIERRPEPRGGLGPVSAYRVQNEVRVTIRDLAQVGPLLDAAVKAGANAVHGVAYQKEDLSAERSRALAAAVADARAKAVVVARSAGRELGEVLEIAEGGGRSPIPMQGMRMMAVAPGEVPVEPGELQVTAQVEIVYSLK